jgi:site-specific recombinase XerD
MNGVTAHNQRLVARYLDEHVRREKQLRHETQRTYGSVLRAFARAVGARPFTEVTPTFISEWTLRERITGREPSRYTRKFDLAVLRGFYEWLVAQAQADHNPVRMVQPPRITNKHARGQRTPIDWQLWCALWASDLTVVERAFLGIAYFGGLRRTEIVRLHGWNVLTVPELTIIDFYRKGGTTDTVPLEVGALIVHEHLPHLLPEPAVLFDAVASVARSAGNGLLLPYGPREETEQAATLRGHALYMANRRLCRRLGLPAFKIHELRHGCATNLLRCGVEPLLVRDYLDHSSLAITELYLEADSTRLRRYLDDPPPDAPAPRRRLRAV